MCVCLHEMIRMHFVKTRPVFIPQVLCSVSVLCSYLKFCVTLFGVFPNSIAKLVLKMLNSHLPTIPVVDG